MTIERMTLADAVCELARAQVGLTERGGNNRGPPIERYAGGREEPWCGHFVAWLFRTVGAPLPGDVVPTLEQHNPIAKVDTLEALAAHAGLAVTDLPRRGDIAVFPWSHVGLVTRFADVGERGYVDTIEGNATNPDVDEDAEAASDGVQRRTRLRSKRVRFFRPVAPPGWEPPTTS